EPYSGNRIRYQDATLRLAQAFTQLIDQRVIDELTAEIGGGDGSNITSTDLYTEASYASLSNLDQFLNLDKDGKPFSSFADFVGPASIYGDQFTNIFTYNLNSMLAVGDLQYDV